MKKRTLKEELERIHSITYGKGYLIEDDMLNAMVQNEPRDTTKPIVDDPIKADYVTSDVTKFFNDLDSIQLLTFDFRSSEDKGNTVFEGTTFYNFELVWVYFIAIILMLIIPASNLFPAAQIKEPTYFLYAGLLVLLSSFLFWFIRNSKQQCLKQFKIILRKVEAAYLMQ